MEVDTVIIRNMVVVMDTALLEDTDILMEAMATEACVNTEEVTENMEDTEITDIHLTEATVMEEDTNRMAKDTEVDTEVTVATNSEVMVVTAALNLEAMVVSVATSSEAMVGLEVVMATLIPIIPQTKMNTSQKLEFLKS